MSLEKTDKNSMKEAICIGIVAAVLVFCFGFGMMSLLWNIIKYPKELPGLFYYKAATFGDAICLPLIAFGLVSYYKYSKRKESLDSKKQKICVIAGVTATIIAVAIQMEWLISDSTVLNWSIPIQHHFNVAGWYHSLFFIGMIGVVAYFLMNICIETHCRNKKYSWFEVDVICILLTFGNLFVLLFLKDDYSDNISIYLLYTIEVMLFFGIMAVLMRNKAKELRDTIIFCCAFSCVCSYNFALLICGYGRGSIFVALGGALCGIMLLNYQQYNLLQMNVLLMILIVSYVGLFYRMSSLDRWQDGLLVMLVQAFFTSIIEHKQFGKSYSNNISILIIILYFVLMASPIKDMVIVWSADMIINFFFKLSIYFVFAKDIKAVFKCIVSAEERKGRGEIDEKKYNKERIKAYTIIILLLIAIVLFIVQWLIDIAMKTENIPPIGVIDTNHIGVGIIIGSVLALTFIKAVSKKEGRYKVLVVIPVTLMYLAMDLILYQYWGNNFAMCTWNAIKWMIFVCSICACIGASALVAYGFKMNLAELRCKGEKVDVKVKIISIALFIHCMIYIVFSSIMLLTEFTWMKCGIAFIGCLFAFILIPILCGMVLQPKYERKNVIPNLPLEGVLQDGFSVTLLYIFEICLPYIYIQMDTNDFLTVLVSLGLILINALCVVLFFLKNNVQHVERQKKLIQKYPDEKWQWERLQKCLRKQNIFTIIALLPYVLLGYVFEVFKCEVSESISVEEAIEKVRREYMIIIDKEKEC